MSIILSIQGYEAAAVSEELRELVSNAYTHQGTVIAIPEEILRESCFDALSTTSDEINAIRRRERTVSTQTLSFSFA